MGASLWSTSTTRKGWNCLGISLEEALFLWNGRYIDVPGLKFSRSSCTFCTYLKRRTCQVLVRSRTFRIDPLESGLACSRSSSGCWQGWTTGSGSGNTSG